MMTSHLAAQFALLCVTALLLDGVHGIMEKSKHVGDNLNVPCKYMDSISSADLDVYANLSLTSQAVQQLGAGRTSFSGDNGDNDTAAELPALSGYFDYEILNDTFRQPATRHQRVCVCSDRPCVRLRCPRGFSFDEGVCTPAAPELSNPSVLVTLDDGNITSVQLFDHFGYTVGRVCEEMTMLEPDVFEEEKWHLTEHGIVWMAGKLRDQHEYNLSPKWNATTGLVEYEMLTCFEPFDNKNRYEYLPYGMILSVPFLFLTFLVYAVLPDLRNAHGKSLMCYLASLASGYTILAYLQLNPGTDNWWCRPFGYLMYFWFLSAFFWLNVISFDLWWTFRDFKGNIRGSRKFVVYSVYSWGVPLVAALFCYAMDTVGGVPSTMQPGFGVERCFIKGNRLIEFVYFQMPMMAIFVANAIFFTLTAIIIRRVQQEIVRMTSKDESRRHKAKLAREKAKYGLFLRLFIVMGVTWSMESLSWVLDPNGWFFVLTDVLNCCQGVLIFVLFVLKPKVKKSLLARWHAWTGTSRDQFSTNTTNSTAVSQTAESSMLMRGPSSKHEKPVKII